MRATQTANQLFAFTTEHAAHDDLDPPGRRGPDDIHAPIIWGMAWGLGLGGWACLRARLVFAGFGVDANDVAFVDERRNLDHDTGLEFRGFQLIRRGRALDAGRRFDNLEINRLRD